MPGTVQPGGAGDGDAQPPAGAASATWRRLRAHLATLVFGAGFLLLGAGNLAGLLPRAPAVAALALLLGALLRTAMRGLSLGTRRLLWRIRRKLILSYVFIAFVPLLLVTTIFAVLGYVAFGQLLGYLGWRHVGILIRDVDDACVAITDRLAQSADAATDFSALRRATEDGGALDPELVALKARYPAAAASVVLNGADPAEVHVPAGFEWPAGVKAGSPSWLAGKRFEGNFVLDPQGNLEVRAAAGRTAGPYRVYVEVAVPLDENTLETLKRFIGTDLRVIEQVTGDESLRVRAATRFFAAARSGRVGALPVFGVFVLTPVRWDSGVAAAAGYVLVAQRSLAGLYQDLTGFRPENRLLVVSLLVILLAVFLLIEGTSLYAGVRLARSITGSIHDISEGALRIERGDFSHRFAIHSDDQLGDLGRAFNRMAAAVERQVAESAERERLEEELRIGRRIQQSLLPRGDWQEQSFEIAAVSLPAREVGGDYYDFFELGHDRLALLVADVSGKGTEAAFYMAELKGIMLALARAESSPRQVLDEANRLLGLSLDRRTFVTMTYAVLDRGTRLLAFGRAGHSPLLYLPSGGDDVECLRPPGLSLGIDRTGRFRGLLEERSVRLGKGDLVLFYTDGVTDTIGPDGEFYGEARLGHALRASRDRTAEGVRDALVAELRRFAIPGPPHDDLTVIVLKAL